MAARLARGTYRLLVYFMVYSIMLPRSVASPDGQTGVESYIDGALPQPSVRRLPFQGEDMDEFPMYKWTTLRATADFRCAI